MTADWIKLVVVGALVVVGLALAAWRPAGQAAKGGEDGTGCIPAANADRKHWESGAA